MCGRTEEGIGWLESRAHTSGRPTTASRFTTGRHLALFHLDRGRYDRVLEVYDRGIYPQPSDLSLQMLDATSLLWRLHLLGQDVRERCERLAAAWEAKLEAERGFYAFNDVHAMLAFAVTGREASAERLLGDMQQATARPGTNGEMTRDVGLPVARALHAFGRGRYDETVAALQPVRDLAQRFGGSHAQRDLLTLTLAEAALRSGRRRLAEHYLAERNVQKPSSALGWRMLARTGS